MKLHLTKWIGLLICAILAVLALRPASTVDALAQQFVTGSANTDGFSIAGLMVAGNNGKGRGDFTILAHRDTVDGATVAVICTYKHFDGVTISGNTATFHSVGQCRVLDNLGTSHSFTSDNDFTIVDNGEPGPGNDTVDVNLASGSGITIPGSTPVDGNFIVSP